MISQLISEPLSSLLFLIIALLIAIDIHEFAHAWVADKLGDPTPRVNGRLTLNPIAHLDPIGTLALFIFQIGWGKPVPIDPFNLKNPRKDAALISLAGPGSNLLMAVFLGIILRIPGVIQIPFFLDFSLPLIIMSIGLAVFNLIPIPPLDGSKIFFAFLPRATAYEWQEHLERYGIIILLFLIFPLFGGQSLLSIVILPVINFVLNIVLPGNLLLKF